MTAGPIAVCHVKVCSFPALPDPVALWYAPINMRLLSN